MKFKNINLKSFCPKNSLNHMNSIKIHEILTLLEKTFSKHFSWNWFVWFHEYFFFGLDLLIFLALCYVLSGWWIFIRKKVPGKNIYFVPIQYINGARIYLSIKKILRKKSPIRMWEKSTQNQLFFFIFVECTLKLL